MPKAINCRMRRPGSKRPALRWAMLVTLLITACNPTRGCIEASFRLSRESRLPNWFASAGVPKAEATATMDYYIGPAGRSATFTLRNAQGRTVASVVGQLKGLEPLLLIPPGEAGRVPYPSYEIITVNGITEIIEHRRAEPIFYVTDDPKVKQQLGVR